MDSTSFPALNELARFHGLETDYYDGLGNYRHASNEAVLAVLTGLGSPVRSPDQAARVLEETRLADLETRLQPIQVHWQDQPLHLSITRPEQAPPQVVISVLPEAGEETELQLSLDQFQAHSVTEWKDRRFLHYRIPADLTLPPGYHRISMSMPEWQGSATLISAPAMAHQPPAKRRWGAFLPLYALHRQRSWGTADYTDLQALMEWIFSQGGSLLGTLPLFPAFLDEPYSPSPYTPISRLFWNEFYLDLRWCLSQVPSETARQMTESESFLQEIERLNGSRTVDYRSIHRLKSKVLEPIVAAATRAGSLHPDLQRYLEAHPLAMEYAVFRARVDKQGSDRSKWKPSDQPKPSLSDVAKDPRTAHYAVTQWLAQTHMDEVLRRGRKIGVDLYLDLPLGVHPDGFDAWRWSGDFVPAISGGAPPDGFFTEGQNWGFPPLHPEEIRRSGYSYLRHVLSHLTRHCDLVRIDHAMSLQRLFWIPLGMAARDGIYVHYRSEELFAVLCLESVRNRCALVGEDLGTVTPEIREGMDHRGVHRMYVGQFDFSAGQTPPFHGVPERVVASLNTHDTATAAGFWYGDDIDDRVALGILDPENAAAEREGRSFTRQAFMRYLGIEGDELDPHVQYAVLQGWLAHLADSQALQVLVTLEDLLQERVPQNVPGTVDERPNWRRKTKISFEALCNDTRVADTLLSIDTKRQSN